MKNAPTKIHHVPNLNIVVLKVSMYVCITYSITYTFWYKARVYGFHLWSHVINHSRPSEVVKYSISFLKKGLVLFRCGWKVPLEWEITWHFEVIVSGTPQAKSLCCFPCRILSAQFPVYFNATDAPWCWPMLLLLHLYSVNGASLYVDSEPITLSVLGAQYIHARPVDTSYKSSECINE